VIQIDGPPRRVMSPAVLDTMTDVMRHRGPNDRGTYLADGVALGVRRLSIVDVAGGHQPFANEDETVWAVQNGELYNHDEIRAALRRDGHSFRTRCDTEILPHLVERDGVRAPEQLRGKFGFAVWDGRRRQALLARDPLGVKPLYYAVSGGLLVFASELKSLLASGLVEPELDYEALEIYLTLGYVPAPRSPLVGVSKLPPGHRLVAGPDGYAVEPYWRYPHPVTEQDDRSEAEWAGDLLAELDEAVRLRLMSDVPLGAMLSGGLDSSLVVALMARHTNGPVKTFSVGFVDAGEVNELADAQLVADRVGADHHPLELSLTDRQVDLAELAWSMDEPVSDLSSLGFLALCELAARHVTVALSGQGADELLGGYLKHKAASLSRFLPGRLGYAAGTIGLLGPARLERTSRTLRARTPAERVLAMSGKLDDERRLELARGPLAALDGRAALRAIQAKANGLAADPLAETLFLDAQLALPDDMLHYFDRASMAHSLEVRVPFLDHRFVEFCARIPTRHKVRGLTGKVLLKRAARGLVPDSIIDKPKVGFFRDSVELWLSSQAEGEVADWLLAPSPRFAEFLDQGAVRRLVDAHRSGRRGNDHVLLAILMLEVWLSSFLPRATQQVAGARAAALSA
jgi:asparagine synthase (glutamine-hydrolysing)